SLGATGLAAPFGITGCKHGRPRIDVLAQDDLKMIVRFIEHLEVRIWEALRRAVNGLDSHEAGPKFESRIQQFDDAVEISPVVSLDKAPDNLDVLLRHRSRSIP